MKRILFLLTALLLVAAAARAEDSKAAKLIYKRNKIEAYSVVRPDGRRVIVATNVGTDPQKLASQKARPVKSVRSTRSTFLRAVPVGGREGTANRTEPEAVPTTPISPAQPQNGIPVCIWHGMLVSPIQVNNQLVCPSEKSLYPINP